MSRSRRICSNSYGRGARLVGRSPLPCRGSIRSNAPCSSSSTRSSGRESAGAPPTSTGASRTFATIRHPPARAAVRERRQAHTVRPIRRRRRARHRSWRRRKKAATTVTAAEPPHVAILADPAAAAACRAVAAGLVSGDRAALESLAARRRVGSHAARVSGFFLCLAVASDDNSHCNELPQARREACEQRWQFMHEPGRSRRRRSRRRCCTGCV